MPMDVVKGKAADSGHESATVIHAHSYSLTHNVPFDELWASMAVEQELEDAYARLMSSYSQIKTVKEAFTKLTLSHVRAIEKWWLAPENAADEPDGVVNEVEALNEKTAKTTDVVLAKKNLLFARELLDRVSLKSEKEDQLTSHWHGLSACFGDVNVCARDYVMRLSARLNELGDQLQQSLIAYQKREEEILRDAELTLETRIVEKFRVHRLERLRRIQRRVQAKHDEDIDEKLHEFRIENEKRAAERSAIDKVKTEISKLRVELSAQPLIRHRKVVVLEDELLEKETTTKLLEAKITQIIEIQEKKAERKERHPQHTEKPKTLTVQQIANAKASEKKRKSQNPIS